MEYINFLSNAIIPIIITLIVVYAIIEKVKVFDSFIEGTKEGANIVVGLFPTLIGLFVAIGALRSSGIINFLVNMLSPITNWIGIPKEIMPLALLRPISRECFYCNWNRHNATIWCR